MKEYTTAKKFQVNIQGVSCDEPQTRGSCGENAVYRAHEICQSCMNSTQCKLIACEYRCVCRDGYIFNKNSNSCIQVISITDSAMSSFEPSNENFVTATSPGKVKCGENMEHNKISSLCHIPFIKSIYTFFKSDGCKLTCICKKGYKKDVENSCKLEASVSYCTLLNKPCDARSVYRLDKIIIKNGDVICRLKCEKKNEFYNFQNLTEK
ncbi:unnamed protein product [Dracunculus medinensis]|uniref:TIL domain-containing protein n=1 Tax=Dracunculus medinensis TaxID=318479 RepID=A0A0N4UKC1_DRAME|nr:unnamed protein product [Dracunculus medinensis]